MKFYYFKISGYKCAGRLFFGPGYDKYWTSIEWVLFSKNCGFSISAIQNENDGLQFSIKIPFIISLYFNLVNFKLIKKVSQWLLRNSGYEDLETSINFHNYSLWWKVWHPTMSWKSTTPKWRCGSLDFADLILGKVKFEKNIIKTENATLCFIDGKYNAKVSIEVYKYKRPRWFTKTIKKALVEIDEGIPIPGKGTTSYNCGEDALYSINFLADNIEEAIGHTIQDVLKIRKKYGGSINWRSMKKFHIIS